MRRQNSTWMVTPGARLLVFVVTLLAPVPYLAANIAVSASIEPGVISVGQSAVYTIRLQNTGTAPDLEPPRVDGLVFGDRGHRSMTNIVNMRRTDEIQITFRVTAEEEGVYRIPGRTLQLRGEDYTINDISLRVTPMDETLRDLFELVLEKPDRPLYLGEAVPVTLKLRVRQGIRVALGGMPERTGEAFVQSTWPPEPRQGNEFVRRQGYQYVAWDVVLNPVRTGRHELRYRIPLAYENPDRMQRDFFGRARAVQERTTLTTGTLLVEVRPLPVEDRPEAFREAIGSFTVDAALSERTVRAGEPITMTVSLSGRGNFERMGSPELPAAPGWRIYPARSRFEAEDDRRVTGTQFFEFLMIPESEAVEAVPEFNFAYFDPDRGRYFTHLFDPEPIEVLPGARPSVAARDFRAAPNREDRLSPPPALRPLKSLSGAWHRDLTPPIATTGFWAAAVLPSLAIVLLGLWLRRRARLGANADFIRDRRLTRAARESLVGAEEAARRGDPPAFYAAAQRTLQETAARWDTEDRHAHSLMETDVRHLLQGADGDDALDAYTAIIFQISDAGKYAGGLEATRNLSADARELRAHITRLAEKRITA